MTERPNVLSPFKLGFTVAVIPFMNITSRFTFRDLGLITSRFVRETPFWSWRVHCLMLSSVKCIFKTIKSSDVVVHHAEYSCSCAHLPGTSPAVVGHEIF